MEARRQARWPELERVEAIRAFMRTGEFPAALAEGGRDAHFSHQAPLTYRRWIEGDVVKLRRQPQFMRESMEQAATTMTSSLSLQTLAKRTQLMSYHTAQDYLSALEQAFALRTVYAYDPDTVEEKLAEMIAAEWLMQEHPGMGYYKTQSGEVDFVGPDRWEIEIKWSNANPNLSQT